jgi:hypothetical protein
MNNSIYIFVKILISITYIFCFTVYVYFLFIELVTYQLVIFTVIKITFKMIRCIKPLTGGNKNVFEINGKNIVVLIHLFYSRVKLYVSKLKKSIDNC